MRSAKILVFVLFGLLAARQSFAQAREVHEEGVFHDKGDPTKAVQIYPNPAVDYLTLKFELPVAKKTKLVMNTIIGSNLEVESEVIDDFELRIKVSNLASGYYLLAIHNAETNVQSTYKFLKR